MAGVLAFISVGWEATGDMCEDEGCDLALTLSSGFWVNRL